MSLHLNLAAGAVLLGEYRGALAAAEVALSLQPGGAKPLYRKAQALLALGEFDESEATLVALLRYH